MKGFWSAEKIGFLGVFLPDILPFWGVRFLEKILHLFLVIFDETILPEYSPPCCFGPSKVALIKEMSDPALQSPAVSSLLPSSWQWLVVAR